MANWTGYLTDKNNNVLNINENNITAGTPVLSGRIVEGKPEYVLRLEITDMPDTDSKVVKLPIKLKEKLTIAEQKADIDFKEEKIGELPELV